MPSLKLTAVIVSVGAALIIAVAAQQRIIAGLNDEVARLEAAVTSLRGLNAKLRSEIASDQDIDAIPDSGLTDVPVEWLLPPGPR